MKDDEPTLGDRAASIPSADTDQAPSIPPARTVVDPPKIPADATRVDPVPLGASAMAHDALHPSDLLADDTSRETPMEPAPTRPQVLGMIEAPTDTNPVVMTARTSPQLGTMPDPPNDDPSTDSALYPRTPSAVAAALQSAAALRPVTARAVPAVVTAPAEELPPTLRAASSVEATGPIVLASDPPLPPRARLTSLHVLGLALTALAIVVVVLAKLSR